MSRQNIITVVCVTAIALAVLYFGTPASETWILKCPLFQFTGLQCPLCGSQRAIHDMLHGNIISSWHYNPALWVFALYLMFIASGYINRRIRQSKVHKWCVSNKGIFTAIGVLLLWGIARNI